MSPTSTTSERRSRRWRFEPIELELDRRVRSYELGREGYALGLLAATMHCDVHVCERWRARGWVTDRAADEIAVALGYHPLYFWDDWADVR